MSTAVANLERRSTYQLSLTWSALPLSAVAILGPSLEPYVAAWLSAVATYAMFKIWTLQEFSARREISAWNAISYLVFWPGMDPSPFAERNRTTDKPRIHDWAWAVSVTCLGAVLIWLMVRQLVTTHPLIAGWVGLVGLVLFLHFGLFHMLALAWRQAGVAVEPIMKAPMLASSVSDFWSHRWNLAFRDLAQVFFFRPFVSRVGAGGAMMIVFAISGLIHDLVISLPSRGGHGWPSLYFLVQGAAVLMEKSKFGRRVGLGRGIRGRIFGWLIVVPGAYWLFHRPFVRHVVLPTLSAIGAF